MMRILETVWLGFFLVGLLVLGILGTWAETAPFWYGAGLISVAGVGSVLSRQNRPVEAIRWSCVVLTLIMFTYLGWRAMNSEVRWMARQDLVFSGTALVVYWLMAGRFTGPRARLAVLAVFFLLIAGNTGLGLYQYFEDPRMSVLRIIGMKRGGELSAGGFFENSNHMAGFMTLAGLPLLGVAVLGRGLGAGVRAAAGLGFLLAGTGVGFSTSRGGAIGFFAGMTVLIAITAVLWWSEKRSRTGKNNSRTGWWLLGLALAFGGLLGLASVNLRKFFGEGQVLNTLNGRQVFWDAALEQWQAAPLLGTGARSYEYMERGFRTLETKWAIWRGEVDAVYAHNDYLQTLGDYGLIGLLLVLLVTGAHFLSALIQVIHRSGGSKTSVPPGLPVALTVGSISALAGLMTQALVEFNLHIGINAVMTGLLLGILATPGFARIPAPVAVRKGPGSEQPAGRKLLSNLDARRLALSGVAAAISVLLLVNGWRLAPADFAWRQAYKQLGTAITLPELITTSGTFQRATTLDPDNAHAWFMRGLVSLKIASMTNEKYARPFYEAALAQLNQSLILYPKNPYAASQAGKVAEYFGQKHEADQYFQTALRWGLTIQSVNEAYGDHLMLRRQYDKAMGYLNIALSLSGDADVRRVLGDKLKFCMNRLKKQGIPAPPEAFLKPGE